MTKQEKHVLHFYFNVINNSTKHDKQNSTQIKYNKQTFLAVKITVCVHAQYIIDQIIYVQLQDNTHLN